LTITAKIEGHKLIDLNTEKVIELKDLLGYTVVDYGDENSIIIFENLQ